MFRPSYLLVAVPLVFAAACGDKFNGVAIIANGATVRFVNATNTPINITNAGLVADTDVVFGAQSGCLNVAVASTGGLLFTNFNNGTTIVFAPSFTVGGSFTVVAFEDATGNIAFSTLNNAFTPNSGSAGLRLFNAVASIPSATVLLNGTAVDGAAAFGTANAFSSIPSGSADVTFESGTTQVLDAGQMTFTAGQSQTIVLGPAAATTTALRSFTVNGC
jgi:hypothetical protein